MAWQGEQVFKALGFWQDPEKPDMGWPDPCRVTEILGPADHDPRRIAYLESGYELATCMGYSWCRFRCGIADARMGCRTLTDGVWAWPEGVVHYLRRHRVPLPPAFIAHAEARDWVMPAAAASWDTMPFELDHDEAIGWYRQQLARKVRG